MDSQKYLLSARLTRIEIFFRALNFSVNVTVIVLYLFTDFDFRLGKITLLQITQLADCRQLVILLHNVVTTCMDCYR